MYRQLEQNVLAVNDNCGLHLRCMAFELHAVIFFSLSKRNLNKTVNEFQCHSLTQVSELHVKQNVKL